MSNLWYNKRRQYNSDYLKIEEIHFKKLHEVFSKYKEWEEEKLQYAGSRFVLGDYVNFKPIKDSQVGPRNESRPTSLPSPAAQG